MPQAQEGKLLGGELGEGGVAGLGVGDFLAVGFELRDVVVNRQRIDGVVNIGAFADVRRAFERGRIGFVGDAANDGVRDRKALADLLAEILNQNPIALGGVLRRRLQNDVASVTHGQTLSESILSRIISATLP